MWPKEGNGLSLSRAKLDTSSEIQLGFVNPVVSYVWRGHDMFAHLRCFLSVSLVVAIPGCALLPDGYTLGKATKAKLLELECLAKAAKSQKLRNVQSYAEFLAIFSSPDVPMGKDVMERFGRDSWGDPFVFRRDVMPDHIRLEISSLRHQPGTDRPISIEIIIPSDDSPIATRRSW